MSCGRPAHDCAVPLAVMYWRLKAVRVFDMWSVRRKTAQSRRAGVAVARLRQAVSEAEAMLLQFEDHIQDLRVSETSPVSLVAKRRSGFAPVAMLPLASSQRRRVNPVAFFGERASSKIAF